MNSQAALTHPTRLVAIVAAVCATVGLVLIAPPAASAVNASQSSLPSAVPSAVTPNINNGAVFTIAQVGSWIVVGGSFTSVTPRGSSTAVTRNHVLAFDANSG